MEEGEDLPALDPVQEFDDFAEQLALKQHEEL